MDWYSNIDFKEDSKFEQGDFINSCPFYMIRQYDGNKLGADVVINNVVIITQSCDLENSKTDRVLVAPWKPLNYHLNNHLQTLTRKNPDKAQLTVKEKRSFFNHLKDGIFHRYHILNCWEEGGLPEHPVIDFAETFSIGLEELTKLALKQKVIIRLNSPYKEHLSQAFARYFMRVGLPSGVKNPFD